MKRHLVITLGRKIKLFENGHKKKKTAKMHFRDSPFELIALVNSYTLTHFGGCNQGQFYLPYKLIYYLKDSMNNFEIFLC